MRTRIERGYREPAVVRNGLSAEVTRAGRAGERPPERDLVGVLEVAADREAAREPGHAHAVAQPVGEVGGSRLARHVRVCREHDLLDPALLDAIEELADPQVGRLDAVERGERAAEDVVEPAVLVRPLERDDVDRLLDDADDRAVAPRVGADGAELLLGQVAAVAAEADALLHVGDRAAERERLVLETESRWNVSRWAVRVPIPGSRVSCATRLSTAGLSTR